MSPPTTETVEKVARAIDAATGFYMPRDHAVAAARAAIAAMPDPTQLLQTMAGALAEVAAERQRQVEAEGWTPEHDDTHNKGEMAVAAACYADPRPTMFADPRITTPIRWAQGCADWDWNPKDRRRNLVRSAALVVAEIERLDRAALAQFRAHQEQRS